MRNSTGKQIRMEIVFYFIIVTVHTKSIIILLANHWSHGVQVFPSWEINEEDQLAVYNLPPDELADLSSEDNIIDDEVVADDVVQDEGRGHVRAGPRPGHIHFQRNSNTNTTHQNRKDDLFKA